MGGGGHECPAGPGHARAEVSGCGTLQGVSHVDGMALRALPPALVASPLHLLLLQSLAIRLCLGLADGRHQREMRRRQGECGQADASCLSPCQATAPSRWPLQIPSSLVLLPPCPFGLPSGAHLRVPTTLSGFRPPVNSPIINSPWEDAICFRQGRGLTHAGRRRRQPPGPGLFRRSRPPGPSVLDGLAPPCAELPPDLFIY